MSNCIFCDIAQGKIATKLIYQDEIVVAFNDLNPQAPQHKLIIPRQHITSLNNLPDKKTCPISHMASVAAHLAKELNINESGYRFVINCNQAGGQTVYHIHAHLLGGRQMNWPPG